MQTQQDDQKDQQVLFQEVSETYTILESLGEGAFGQVYRAKHKTTGQEVAIKLIQDIQSNEYMTRKVLREIIILRKLTEMQDNIFTTKLIDLILPDGVIKQKCPEIFSSFECYDFTKLTHIFMVMEVEMQDLKSMMRMTTSIKFDEEHVKIIMYNLLCAITYLHSTKIIHRDIKPGNILIDNKCKVKICDFGLARAQNKRTSVEDQIYALHKTMNLYSQDQKDLIQHKGAMSDLLNQTKQERSKKKRDLTTAVQTRWYRAPEVILTETDYNEAVDIWGMGLILAELMKCSDKCLNTFQGKRQIFRGQSCYPISPADPKNQEIISEGDQIFKIISKMPSINHETDLTFLSDENSNSYLKNVMQKTKNKGSIAEKFSSHNPELVKILCQMLEFNPHFRPSAKQLLQNKIFDSIRQNQIEIVSKFRIKVNIDTTESLKMDYENCIENVENQKQFLKLIVKEYKKFKENKKENTQK